jgi:hypothetical protein
MTSSAGTVARWREMQWLRQRKTCSATLRTQQKRPQRARKTLKLSALERCRPHKT